MHPRSTLLRCVAAGALAPLLLCCTAAVNVNAQQAGGTVDSLARAFLAQHPIPAMVIGVLDSKGEHIHTYGTFGDDSAPVTGDTRFEVGSVTKIFTSLLLARMAEHGEVRVDDPIARYLPDSVKAPEYRGKGITLRELATHSSSLPRLPSNLAPANMSDPYADYDAGKLYAFLDSYDLPQAPDTHYEYSNLGAGLLGFLLSRHAGKPFAELLHEQIFEPLGMRATYMAEVGDTTDTLVAQGHAGGKPVAFWHFGALEGAGGVRSSTNDLLRLLRAELHPDGSAMSKAIELSQEIRYRPSAQLALALGWHVVQLPDSSNLYWHNGGTGGARSFIGFAPDAGGGFALLMNEALPLDVVNQFALSLASATLVR